MAIPGGKIEAGRLSLPRGGLSGKLSRAELLMPRSEVRGFEPAIQATSLAKTNQPRSSRASHGLALPRDSGDIGSTKVSTAGEIVKVAAGLMWVAGSLLIAAGVSGIVTLMTGGNAIAGTAVGVVTGLALLALGGRVFFFR
jgi:hypothetical protein